MTWKRVATAAVLIPAVVGMVLWGSTAVVALGVFELALDSLDFELVRQKLSVQN